MSVGYSRKYDSYYDLMTGEWAEEKCIDPDCEYCKDRPDKAPLCKYGDPLCPCVDGDPCHYEGENSMTPSGDQK